ncbi:ABC transporter substrate-binding protein [Polaribacter sp. ALD11]|uniref:ABC transporter substrate-binding protein n=1 Tax=Polaribacter sp. ALD11 TaxID=2058137 RepID=UPI000C317E54|nr:ABC transporter substrate-binding protein [Polaribacter sp. ALD11]AUC84034.1 ABC transporter substrate-binding protein [Polaribacter sp. ALD11]
MKKQLKISFLFFLFLLIISCKKETQNTDKKTNIKSNIKYAKGFDIIENNGIKKLIIKSAYQNSKEEFTYTVRNKNKISNNLQNNDISTPIKKIVVTSTTHIPMVELLNEETAIIGFPYSKFVSSEKTRELIDNGSITEIGQKGSLNTEILLNLDPELIVGYSVSSADKSLNLLEKAGVNVIYNGDWLEETPLGRAEWIKFFGVLFDKEKKADSIFNAIEKNYLDAKKIVNELVNKPSVLSGAVISKDIWNLPAGESFVATSLSDANFNYLWKDTKGKGSLSLSFESVFEKGKNADFWLAPGHYSSKEELIKSNVLYAEFKAFKNNKIYTPTNKKGKTGGILYYELATVRPDLVLKDFIKIAHPELLPNYEFTFYEKLK